MKRIVSLSWVLIVFCVGLFRSLKLSELGWQNSSVTVNQASTLQAARPVDWSFSLKGRFFVISLIAAVFITAFSLVYVKDVNRRLMGELQSLQNTSNQLHNQWSRLLLEESTLVSSARVAAIAQKQLDMVMPAQKKIVEV